MSDDKKTSYAIHVIRNPYGHPEDEIKELARYLGDRIEKLEVENERLKRGDFTDEELAVIAANPRFQDLCHNLPPEVGLCKFADGCDAEQRMLFGTCRTDQQAATLRQIHERLDRLEAKTNVYGPVPHDPRMDPEYQKALAELKARTSPDVPEASHEGVRVVPAEIHDSEWEIVPPKRDPPRQLEVPLPVSKTDRYEMLLSDKHPGEMITVLNRYLPINPDWRVAAVKNVTIIEGEGIDAPPPCPVCGPVCRGGH